jgi:bifunctional DNA primase/polymerase-like protein
VRTGTASGIDVLDLDAKHASAKQWWADNRHRLPPTRTHRTPGGGIHLILAHVDGLRCSTSKLGRGIDVKADGGCCVWWPAAGQPVLHEGPLAPWPAWLLARLKPPTPPPPPLRRVIPDDRRLQQLLRRVATAHEGERNDITYWASCRFREMVATGLISETDAMALIIDAAMAAGLRRGEAIATARSGLRGR